MEGLPIRLYEKGLEERLDIIKRVAGLGEEDLRKLREGLPLDLADTMVENVIGTFQLPLGVATNLRVNGKDYLVPMATEEASVVAAASNAAKLALPDGFEASSTKPVVRGQVQIIGLDDLEAAAKRVLSSKQKILDEANEHAGSLPKLGGGVIDIGLKTYETPRKMLIVELYVDCRDAMGANAINTIAEGVSPQLEELTGGKSLLRILSNFTTERIAKARVVYRHDRIGEEVAEGVLAAYDFALADPYRAVTHNKGIMNGITAVAIATGNDSRALEAAAHAYAAISGSYKPLSRWKRNELGDLLGELEMPISVGTVGGVTKVHPVAQAALKILGVKGAGELAEVICAVGLAQNFAALRALVSEGIQRGHMKLHSKNIAVMAGAKGEEINRISEIMIAEKNIRFSRAKELIEGIRKEKEQH